MAALASKLNNETTGQNGNGQMDALERFYALAPKRPYCMDEPGYSKIRSKELAFKERHVQHNPPSIRQWLTFDQDHENYWIWEEKQLAVPNLIVRNLHNRRCHISYAIESVCTSDAARPKPLYYMAAVQAAYCNELESDPGYAHHLTKNPYHSHFHCHEIHDHVYSLGERADYVDMGTPAYRTRKQADNDEVFGLGRNCNLFDRLRYWAYDHVNWYRLHHTYNEWMNVVLEKSEGYNTFTLPLPYCDIKATAKSVGKWTWTRYFPEGKRVRRGVMSDSFKQSQLPLDLKKKQRLAARHTNEMQKQATEAKIIEAIGQLIAANKRVTKAAVASITGIHRNSLGRNYSHLFKD